MKKNKLHRLLFCSLDIGGRIELYTNFLNKNYNDRVIPESFVKYKLAEKHYRTDYKYHFQYEKYPSILQWFISLAFFVYALFKYDIFYVISAENILTRKLLAFELFTYRLLRKKIVMHFVGADIRSVGYLKWKNASLTSDKKKSSPPLQSYYQKKVCALAEKYADFIIITSPDLFTFFTNKNLVHYIPVFLDEEKFSKELAAVNGNNGKASNIITILHAPSNPPLKGTDFIEKVLKDLKKSIENLKIIITSSENLKKESVNPPYSVSKYKLNELYMLSDIVIDQILIGWYGMQSIEALLAGNIVICLIEKDLRNYIFPDCPIRIINNHTELRSAIESEIKNVQDKAYKNPAREWILKYHNIDKNLTISNIFNQLLTQKV